MKIKDCEVGLSYTGLTYIHVNTVQQYLYFGKGSQLLLWAGPQAACVKMTISCIHEVPAHNNYSTSSFLKNFPALQTHIF